MATASRTPKGLRLSAMCCATPATGISAGSAIPGRENRAACCCPTSTLLTGWSMLVIDPKADLLNMCGAHRAAHGAENVVFDPFGISGSRRVAAIFCNALDPASDDFVDDAMGQAEGIVEVGNTNEPHWPESFQDLLAAVAMFVRLVIPGGTYADVRALLRSRTPLCAT